MQTDRVTSQNALQGATSSSRPGRYKKACNDCSAAKVKCSGERDGCQRCSEMGQQCLYELSRVGKVPGIRAKKNSRVRNSGNAASHVTPITRPQGNGLANAQEAALPRTNAGGGRAIADSIHSVSNKVHGVDNPNSAAFLLNEDLFVDTGEDLIQPYDASHMPFTDQAATPLSTMTISSSDLPEMDLLTGLMDVVGNHQTPLSSDMFSDTMSSSSSRANWRTVQPSMSPNSGAGSGSMTRVTRELPESRDNSQCILACAAIVSKLEIFIEARVRILHPALDTVKSGLDTLNVIVQQAPLSERCMLLLLVIIDQILRIIEISSELLTEQPQQQQQQQQIPIQSGPGHSVGARVEDSSSLESENGILSRAGMTLFRGGIEFDLGEQRAIQARSIRKELLKVEQTWQQIKVLLNKRSSALCSETGSSSFNTTGATGRPAGILPDAMQQDQQGQQIQQNQQDGRHSHSHSPAVTTSSGLPSTYDDGYIARITTRLASLKAWMERVQSSV